MICDILVFSSKVMFYILPCMHVMCQQGAAATSTPFPSIRACKHSVQLTAGVFATAGMRGDDRMEDRHAKSMNRQHAVSSLAMIRRNAPAAASSSSRDRHYRPASRAEGHGGPANEGVVVRVRQMLIGSLYRCKASMGHP